MAFVQARSLSQISLEFDIQQATKNRSALESVLEQLGKLMDACGGPLRATIDSFDKQLSALSEQIEANEKVETSLFSKLTECFAEACA